MTSEQPDWEIELSVLFCESGKMQALNREYRGQDKPTDILSFVRFLRDEIPLAEFDNCVICDIVIDINQVARQKGTSSFEEELLIVFIHGVLHLMGYDHIRNTDKTNMEILERKYLKRTQGEMNGG